MGTSEIIQQNYGPLIKELRESLGWMDTVFANINEGIIVVDDDLKALFVNDAVAKILEKPRISILGQYIWKILQLKAEGGPLRKNDYEKAREQNNLKSLAGQYKMFDEDMLTVDITISLIPNKEQAVFIIRDVTQQVRDEQVLLEERLAYAREKARREKVEENQHLLQSIIDGTTAVIFLKDFDGKYIMVNNQFRKAFEAEETEIKERTDPEIFTREIAEILQKNDSKVLETKESLRWEEEIPHESGSRYYLYLKFPLLDSDGKPHSLCGVLTDISARKELESRKEDFIRMASHELKTPLFGVQIMLNFVKEHIEKGETEKALNEFSKFENQLENVTDLIDNLLDVSRMETGRLELKPREFNLNKLVKETIEVAQSTTQKHTIHLREKSKAQEIVADRQRIEQVLLNLLTNAIKYSPEGGEIIVRIKRSGEHVVVSVQDFGLGISEKNQEKVFSRFFRESTSGEEPGLGMGLYISSQIINRHGGTITVNSEKGEGSIFSFWLPVEGEEI